MCPGNDSVLSHGFASGGGPELVHRVERMPSRIDAAIGLELGKKLAYGFDAMPMESFQAFFAMVQSGVELSEYEQSHTK